ncbi:MAG: transketolase, partial [Acetanaerobacterium sp.]
KNELNVLCNTFRKDVISLLYKIGTGHPGGSLSVCEILTVLYMEKANISPENQDSPDRDKIVLSKGHAAPMLYRILAECGFFPSDEMSTLRQIGSHLQGHPCSVCTPGIEMTTGPLGIGFAAALGITLADRLDCRDCYTYAVLGDGELNEGVVWETCMNSSKQNANHLITIVDCNGVQLDGKTDDIMPLGSLEAKFQAFGFHTLVCDGHDVTGLCNAIEDAKCFSSRPCVIIAKTVKGKGVSFMEGNHAWHGSPIDEEHYKLAMKDLEVLTDA